MSQTGGQKPPLGHSYANGRCVRCGMSQTGISPSQPANVPAAAPKGTEKPSAAPETATKPDLKLKIEKNKKTIANVAPELCPSALLDLLKNEAPFKSGTFTVLDGGDMPVADGSFVGTGCRVSDIAGSDDGINVIYTIIVSGDTDGDGEVTASDARAVLRHAAKLEGLKGEFLAAADLNGDGSPDASAARMILRYVAKLETSL